MYYMEDYYEFEFKFDISICSEDTLSFKTIIVEQRFIYLRYRKGSVV